MQLENGKLKHLGSDFSTYIASTAHTTDIILSNNKIDHNHTIKGGPVTPSDHIPIIFTVTATAIETL